MTTAKKQAWVTSSAGAGEVQQRQYFDGLNLSIYEANSYPEIPTLGIPTSPGWKSPPIQWFVHPHQLRHEDIAVNARFNERIMNAVCITDVIRHSNELSKSLSNSSQPWTKRYLKFKLTFSRLKSLTSDTSVTFIQSSCHCHNIDKGICFTAANETTLRQITKHPSRTSYLHANYFFKPSKDKFHC